MDERERMMQAGVQEAAAVGLFGAQAKEALAMTVSEDRWGYEWDRYPEAQFATTDACGMRAYWHEKPIHSNPFGWWSGHGNGRVIAFDNGWESSQNYSLEAAACSIRERPSDTIQDPRVTVSEDDGWDYSWDRYPEAQFATTDRDGNRKYWIRMPVLTNDIVFYMDALWCESEPGTFVGLEFGKCRDGFERSMRARPSDVTRKSNPGCHTSEDAKYMRKKLFHAMGIPDPKDQADQIHPPTKVWPDAYDQVRVITIKTQDGAIVQSPVPPRDKWEPREDRTISTSDDMCMVEPCFAAEFCHGEQVVQGMIWERKPVLRYEFHTVCPPAPCVSTDPDHRARVCAAWPGGDED